MRISRMLNIDFFCQGCNFFYGSGYSYN